MKKMRTLMCGLLAAGTILGAGATSAMAAEVTEANPGANLETAFTFEYKNDPTYTVTIPSAVTLTEEGTEVEIIAENVENLDGKHVSITFEGTDKFREQMVLEGKTESGRSASLRYQFIMEDGSVFETTGDARDLVGTELVSFTEDGTATMTVKPVLSGSSSIIKGVTYTGSVTYGISLAE